MILLLLLSGCSKGGKKAEETAVASDTETTIQSQESVFETESEPAGLQIENSSETEESMLPEVEETESQEEKSFIQGVVAIDPGHQGGWVDMSGKEPYAPGSSELKAKATSGTKGKYSGIYEYELNLDIGLMLARELRLRGYEVVMLREDNDTAISNSERAIKANDSGADITIRLHADGVDDSSVNGASMLIPSSKNKYVGNLHEDSKALGEAVLECYCEATGMKNRGLSLRDDLTGTNWSKIPVALLEMGFMSNESDDKNMADEDFRRKMVQGIADGIDLYFADHPSQSQGLSGSAKIMNDANSDDSSLEEFLNELDNSQEASSPGTVKAAVESIARDYTDKAQKTGETWAVTITDMFDGSQADINGDEQVISASVIKVFIMAAVYERVLDPDSETAAAASEQSKWKNLIEKMITVSDNNASNTLVEMLGDGDFSKGAKLVNAFCQDHGYTRTSLGRRFLGSNEKGDNYTSSNDCARILQDIYNNALISKEASGEMLSYLKSQQWTNKIPKGIEEFDAETANKTGELAGNTGICENDIAIVWGRENDYVLCILASNLKSGNEKAISMIRDISRTVYQEIGQ